MNLLQTADDTADAILRTTKKVIRPAARVMLLSTFIEDGFRMLYQWEDQTSYIQSAWNCGSFLAWLFVIINLVGQLVPTLLIMIRKSDMQVRIGVFALAAVMLLQTVAYTVLWNFQFFLRNIAVGGSLVLVYAETAMEGKTMIPGLPSAGGVGTADYLQAVGRVMVVVMFLTMMHFDSVARVMLEIFEGALLSCVAIGFRAKLAALILVVVLLGQNVWLNAFWFEPAASAIYDFKKYDFFQTLSVIGGLLMIVALGPGGVAMDERKKDF